MDRVKYQQGTFILVILFLYSLIVWQGFRSRDLMIEHAACIQTLDRITEMRLDRVVELDSMIAQLQRPYEERHPTGN